MTFKIGPAAARMLETKVLEAMGFASVCWSTPPDGVFQSELASEKAEELIQYILEFFDAEVTESGCSVCGQPIVMSIFKNEKWCSELCRRAYLAMRDLEEAAQDD